MGSKDIMATEKYIHGLCCQKTKWCKRQCFLCRDEWVFEWNKNAKGQIK